jgi:hypothetical protein
MYAKIYANDVIVDASCAKKAFIKTYFCDCSKKIKIKLNSVDGYGRVFLNIDIIIENNKKITKIFEAEPVSTNSKYLAICAIVKFNYVGKFKIIASVKGSVYNYSYKYNYLIFDSENEYLHNNIVIEYHKKYF